MSFIGLNAYLKMLYGVKKIKLQDKMLAPLMDTLREQKYDIMDVCGRFNHNLEVMLQPSG